MEFNVEIIGVVSTVFIVLSFVFSGEIKIRCINIIGAILFVIYGVLIGAFSVYLSNGIIALIHIYKIVTAKTLKIKNT